MNRRGFLTALAGAIGAMTLDPERLLWRPGAKLISIPTAPKVYSSAAMGVGDIITIAGRFVVNPRTRRVTKVLQQFVVTGVSRSSVQLFPHTEKFPGWSVPTDLVTPLYPPLAPPKATLAALTEQQ